jgi:hypothetical protein
VNDIWAIAVEARSSLLFRELLKAYKDIVTNIFLEVPYSLCRYDGDIVVQAVRIMQCSKLFMEYGQEAGLLELLVNLPAGVGGMVEKMAIAEKEISVAQQEYLEKAEQIWDIFGLLGINISIWPDNGSDLFRAHVRELCARVGQELDLRPGTDAEICWTIYESTLKFPVRPVVSRAYMKLFSELFAGFDLADEVRDVAARMDVMVPDDEVDLFIASMREQLCVESRNV